MNQLLLEIGAEEIPASFLGPALSDLERRVRAALSEHDIPAGRAELFSTPRRLALRLIDVADGKPAQVVELQGPPRKAAFDPQGNPTKTAVGFSAAHGKTPADLYIKPTPRGEYVFIKKQADAVPTTKVLREGLPGIIASLPFPKNMRWDASGVRFARPIRWLVCLFGTEIVEFQFGELKSGADSQGLRNSLPRAFPIPSPAEYEATLRTHGVIVPRDARRTAIAEELNRLAADAGGRPVEDEELLEETTDITESPELLLCAFNPDYLELPAEVLVTALKKHERCFSIQGSGIRDLGSGVGSEIRPLAPGPQPLAPLSALLPHFVAVTNTPGCDAAAVSGWYEKATESRLRDARFFVEADLKHGLEALVEEEKQVTWIEGMGTYFDKTQRLRELCRHLASESDSGPGDTETLLVPASPRPRVSASPGPRVPASPHPRVSSEALDRAALLCKADLLTNMVREKEFTSLQGRIGGIYARRLGEPATVADAIAEHYLPRFVGDKLPTTRNGALLSIADKLDNIVATFLTGEIPTGSEDPFALRRQATGLLAVILEHRLPVDVADLLTKAVNAFPREQWQHTGELVSFFKERLASTLTNMGISYDAANAVAETSLQDPRLALDRAQAIAHFRGNPDFEKLITGQKRVANILKGLDEDQPPDKKLFTDEAEQILWQRTEDTASELNRAWVAGPGTPDFDRIFRALLNLRPDIDRFFDDVLVMDKDVAVRANRLRLLAFVREQFLSFADLSQIVLPGQQKDSGRATS